jgi:predicted acetyltransferase
VDIEVRPLEGEDELVEWVRVCSAAFGSFPEPDGQDDERTVMPLDRAIAAFDDGAMVATTSAYNFDLTLPGGSTTPTAGVTGVTVSNTHRRRGILTEMMRNQLDDVADRGEAIAVLTASETSIYSRFGYGLASSYASFEIDKRRSAFREPLEPSGRLDLIGKDGAASIVSDLYDRYGATRPGWLTRSEDWWKILLSDRRSYKGGGKYFVVTHRDQTGAYDGYAFYETAEGFEGNLWRGTLTVRELIGLTPEVEAALWRHCLDVDLCATLVAPSRPVDDPIRWRLADPRELITRGVSDMLWVRLVELPTALCLRRYSDEGSVAFTVSDPFLPQNEGTYRLSVSGDGAECELTDDDPDFTLGVDSLGAAYLGGVGLTTLARAGRIDVRDPATLARADVLFSWPVAPYCITLF